MRILLEVDNHVATAYGNSVILVINLSYDGRMYHVVVLNLEDEER